MTTADILLYMTRRLPPFVREDPVILGTLNAIAPALALVMARCGAVPLQAMPHLTTEGIERMERVFGIVPNPALPLDTRRGQLILRVRGRGTMTPAKLCAILNTLAGGSVSLNERISTNTVDIICAPNGEAQVPIGIITATARAYLPAHLAVGEVFTLLANRVFIQKKAIGGRYAPPRCGTFCVGGVWPQGGK